MFKSDYRQVLPLLVVLGMMSPAMADEQQEMAQASAVDITPLSAQPSAGGSVAADEQGFFARLWQAMGADADAQVVDPGERTNSWLAMQREATAASANPQAASAVQREKAADRFLKTYDYAIKESYYGDNFKSGK